MKHARRWVSGVAAALTTSTALAAAGAGTPEPGGVWMGQDGRDYCQTSTVLKPNDIQDLHIRFESLPSGEVIEGVLVRRAGGGEWAWGNRGGRWTWKAHLVCEPPGTTAELFMEPSHDEERFRVDIEVAYRGGRADHFSLNCGRSNPNLFMPAAMLRASWVGQDGQDWTGPGPAVGPDGIEDVRLDLAGLSTKLDVKSLVVRAAGGGAWAYGLNPDRWSNAELLRDEKEKSRGSLFLSPDGDLKGRELAVCVTYANDRSNSTALLAGLTDPKRAMPKPPEIRFSPTRLSSRWLGQDDRDPPERGAVHLQVQGLPPDRVVAAAALSDKAGGFWVYRRDPKVRFYPEPGAGDIPSLPLTWRQQNGGTVAGAWFPPYRDETATPMVLRVLLDDGTTLVHRLVGETCDAYRRGPLPAAGRVDAKPGDDLEALAGKYGTLRLAAGRYLLDHPLRLNRPVTIFGERDAVLAFTQKTEAPAWEGAILIGAGNVTLRGFTVRFSGDFRWNVRGPGGAALIRTVDRPGSTDPLANIVLEQLDIESSSVQPPADPKQTPEAPYLARLAGATSGKILGNRFRGGTVDEAHGPWLIADNEHEGPLPGTVAWDAFGGHWLHDFTLERNRVRAAAPGGKMWRFLSMNQLGQRIVIRENVVSGVGMRDDDSIPNPNAPEILLTESYRLSFEGKPAATSSGGYVLQIPLVMHGTVRPGALVSILTGPHAGRYFAIAQPISATAFLMADPLPAGDYAISVAHGFVDGLIERNQIDVRGGASAVVVLAGNHWNLRLLHNRLMGGGDSLLVQSTPTEAPFIWGWSHTPFLDLRWEGNMHEGSRRGVSVDVYSDRHNKTTAGRTYLTGVCRDNIIQGDEIPPSPARAELEAIRIGSHSADDPRQMSLVVEGNRCRAASPSGAFLELRHATINGEPLSERKIPLPR